ARLAAAGTGDVDGVPFVGGVERIAVELAADDAQVLEAAEAAIEQHVVFGGRLEVAAEEESLDAAVAVNNVFALAGEMTGDVIVIGADVEEARPVAAACLAAKEPVVRLLRHIFITVAAAEAHVTVE